MRHIREREKHPGGSLWPESIQHVRSHLWTRPFEEEVQAKARDRWQQSAGRHGGSWSVRYKLKKVTQSNFFQKETEGSSLLEYGQRQAAERQSGPHGVPQPPKKDILTGTGLAWANTGPSSGCTLNLCQVAGLPTRPLVLRCMWVLGPAWKLQTTVCRGGGDSRRRRTAAGAPLPCTART